MYDPPKLYGVVGWISGRGCRQDLKEKSKEACEMRTETCKMRPGNETHAGDVRRVNSAEQCGASCNPL